MNDAVYAPLAAGDDRDDKPVIADSDEIFLQGPVLVMRAQEARQRFLDLAALPFTVAAQARQHDTCVVGQRSVRENLAAKMRAARTMRRRLPKVTASCPSPWLEPRRSFTSTNTVAPDPLEP